MAFYRTLVDRLLTRRPEPENRQVSYAQCGEDLIVDFVLSQALGLTEISYLDIGAFDPTNLSNTYLFYQKGHRGVCVEPDPDLFDRIKRVRSEDTCLNVGIGVSEESDADFYRLTTRTLNTFSKADAERYQNYGNQKIEQVMSIPLHTIDWIIEKYFKASPHFISLDVEGLDFEILKSLDFSNFRPQVLCVETLTYTEDKSERKLTEIIEFMASNKYFAYADTYINTIFVDREAWANR